MGLGRSTPRIAPCLMEEPIMNFRYPRCVLVLLLALLSAQGVRAQATAPGPIAYSDAVVSLRVETEANRLRLYIAEAAGAQNNVLLSEQLTQVVSLQRAGDRALVVGR